LDFADTTARAAALLAGLGSGQWVRIDQLPMLANGRYTFPPRLPPKNAKKTSSNGDKLSNARQTGLICNPA